MDVLGKSINNIDGNYFSKKDFSLVEDIKEAQNGVSSSTVSFASNEMYRLSHTINSEVLIHFNIESNQHMPVLITPSTPRPFKNLKKKENATRNYTF